MPINFWENLDVRLAADVVQVKWMYPATKIWIYLLYKKVMMMITFNEHVIVNAEQDINLQIHMEEVIKEITVIWVILAVYLLVLPLNKAQLVNANAIAMAP